MNRFVLLFFALLSLTVAGAQAQIVPADSAAATHAPDVQTKLPPVMQPMPGDGRQGTVKTVRGEVALVYGQIRRAAVGGGAVRQGERIVVGANSSAAIALRDGTVVSVGPNSSVELSDYRFEPVTEDGNIVLSLFKGSLRVVTGLITRAAHDDGPARVKVITPTAVIGVRGTDVVVDADS